MSPRKATLVTERLWARVEVQGPDDCWEWTGFRNASGHGQISIGNHRARGPHRIAWESVNGPIPEGLYVCHTCDNPPCCNPSHLFLGTCADNLADMRTKDRHARGIRVPNAVLTDADVVEMRRAARDGESVRSIASRYGVVIRTARSAVNGRNWKHVDEPTFNPNRRVS